MPARSGIHRRRAAAIDGLENTYRALEWRIWPWASGIGSPLARLALVVAAVCAGALVVFFVLTGQREGWDAHAYYAAPLSSPYSISTAGAPDAYLYSPAFRQAIAPLAALPWPLFLGVWEVLLVAATILVAGPLAIAIMLVPLVSFELEAGNVHLLLALAVVAGFRYPAAWSFVLLTKVTPGVGLLWFAARREWRNLAVALVATAAIVGASILVAPGLWFEWVGVLTRNTGTPVEHALTTVPLAARVALAAVTVIAGALTNRRWTVPLAATMALPVLAAINLTMLVGVVPLAASDARRWWIARAARSAWTSAPLPAAAAVPIDARKRDHCPPLHAGPDHLDEAAETPAHKGERGDGDERDEHEDQAVLDQSLPVVAIDELAHAIHHERHPAVAWPMRAE
jgi:hypothetical protein